MNKKDCLNCKWDKLNPQGQRMIQCDQGHVRPFQKIIDNCHAWEEKERCWCDYPVAERNNWNVSIRGPDGLPNPVWSFTFCPVCGRSLND